MGGSNNVEYFSEVIDQLTTVDLRGRGVVSALRKAARTLYKEAPAMRAARLLAENVSEGDTVLCLTGMSAYGMRAETDGPPGIVGLARSLAATLGARPVFLIHEQFVDVMRETALAGGLMPITEDELEFARRKVKMAAPVIGFPVDDASARALVADVMKRYEPKAVVALELRGANNIHRYHSWDGSDLTDREAKFKLLLDQAAADGIPTVGVFDGCGHEVGFGSVADQILPDFPFYGKCQCGCEQGMRDDTNVDAAVPAAVSNWGGYAIATALGLLTGSSAAIHGPDVERLMIAASARAGAIDGVLGYPAVRVDDVPLDVHATVVEMLGEILRNAQRGFGGGINLLKKL